MTERKSAMKSSNAQTQLQLPSFLYGTAWKEQDTQRCVEDALAAGFRGIDTANQRKHYHEAGVGDALKKWFSEGRIQREKLFLQTKFTFARGQDHRLPYDPHVALREQVYQSFSSSLEHLGVDYIDSFIVHGPALNQGLSGDDWEVWNAMETLAEKGKVRAIGVSNVNLDQLRLLNEGAKIKPAFVQNRCFARTKWDYRVRTYCLQHNIVYQGFSLLTANPEIFNTSYFRKIMQRVGCTPAQLVFRFSQQIGMLPLTGTTDQAHMREDLQSERFELTQEELLQMENVVAR